MSAVLGPIHGWLFRKIHFQDALTNAILQYVEEEKQINMRRETNQSCGVLEQGELKDIIDESNIHGWLQERISLVEKRLAFVVTQLTKEQPEQMMDISDAVYQFGKEHEAGSDLNVREAYQYLEDLLLNGMPCDHVNRILKETGDSIVWEETTDLHQTYWKSIGGNSEFYYAIRESLILGMFETSGINFEVQEGHKFELKKET